MGNTKGKLYGGDKKRTGKKDDTLKGATERKKQQTVDHHRTKEPSDYSENNKDKNEADFQEDTEINSTEESNDCHQSVKDQNEADQHRTKVPQDGNENNKNQNEANFQEDTEINSTEESNDGHQSVKDQNEANFQEDTEINSTEESNDGHQSIKDQNEAGFQEEVLYSIDYHQSVKDQNERKSRQRDKTKDRMCSGLFDPNATGDLLHYIQKNVPLYRLGQKPKGIQNLGNTCYMNAVLQVLVWTPLLLQKLTNQHKKYQNQFAGITSKLLELCHFVHDSEKMNVGVPRYIPENILNSARRLNSTFNGHRQQDSFEMFNTLIGGIEDEAKNKIHPEKIWVIERIINEMPVSRLFGGMYLTIFYYETCGHVEAEFQRFTSICVPVSNAKPLDQTRIPVPLQSITGRKNKKRKKPKFSIESGLTELTNIETWEECILSCRKSCPVGQMQTMKRMFIYEFPPVLVLQINRFSQTMNGKLEKIQTTVEYDHLLDLTPFCHSVVETGNEKVLYSLYGVVFHSGNISGGHYMAYVKTTDRYEEQIRKLSTEKWDDPAKIQTKLEERLESSKPKDAKKNQFEGSTKRHNKGSWYYVSDSVYNKVTQNDVINVPGAYILMYEKI